MKKILTLALVLALAVTGLSAAPETAGPRLTRARRNWPSSTILPSQTTAARWWSITL